MFLFANRCYKKMKLMGNDMMEDNYGNCRKTSWEFVSLNCLSENFCIFGFPVKIVFWTEWCFAGNQSLCAFSSEMNHGFPWNEKNKNLYCLILVFGWMPIPLALKYVSLCHQCDPLVSHLSQRIILRHIEFFHFSHILLSWLAYFN